MSQLSDQCIELRLTIPKLIDRMIKTGKACNQKKAFRKIWDKNHKLGIDDGFNEKCFDKAYRSYMMFKSNYGKHITHKPNRTKKAKIIEMIQQDEIEELFSELSNGRVKSEE